MSCSTIVAISVVSAAAACCVIALPMIAGAQTGTSSTPVRRAQAPDSQNSTENRHVQSLADILDKLDWDPAARGPLLIVSPEETMPYVPPPNHLPDGATVYTAFPPLEATASGMYRAADVADFYDRRLVPLKTLTVLAPRTMTVLNYTHLPDASPYAGMSDDTKLRVLESTFTDGQWAQVSSESGIGVGDMDSKQRDLYLSLLPNPFTVVSQHKNAAGDFERTIYAPDSWTQSLIADADRPKSLSPNQREAVRLKLEKRLDWSLQDAGNRIHMGVLGVGDSVETAYGIDYQPRGMSVSFGPMPSNPPKPPPPALFGVELSSVVPNHPKPSELPADWSALDVTFAAGSANTVGRLVFQIARQTGVQLFCDPRYADRTLVVKGDTAQAGDLLRALAWAVTGAWRRVGDAFLLTDDLVGLAVRHAKIDDLMQQDILLAHIRDGGLDKTLLANEYRAVGWSDNDPLRPSDAIIAKIDAYVADLQSQQGPGVKTPEPLLIPVADLSQAEQDVFRRQIELYSQQPFYTGNNPEMAAVRSAIPRMDVVRMDVRTQPFYLVPNFGKVHAANLVSGKVGSSDLLHPMAGRDVQVPRVAPKPAPSKLSLSASPPARALLIPRLSPADTETIAREAHARGFTQLWIRATSGDEQALADVIRTGTAQGLAVHAVVDALRAEPTDSPKTLDRNVLGQTISDVVRERRQQMHTLGLTDNSVELTPRFANSLPLTYWVHNDQTERLLQHGDYRSDSEADRGALVNRAVAIASTPGLAGIILQDTMAPGSESVGGIANQSLFGGNPLLQMGYTEAMRLACLRRNGFDPIDLSLNPMGDHLELSGLLAGIVFDPNIELPFFRDYGTNASHYSRGDTRADELGAKDAWARWRALRHEQSVALVQAVSDAIRVHHPNFPILIQHNDDPLTVSVNWYGSLEKPRILQANNTVSPARSSNAKRPSGRDVARAESRTSYLLIACDPLSYYGDRQTHEVLFLNIDRNLKRAAEWDGVVIDLGDASVDHALEIVETFEAAPALAATAAAH